MWSQKLDHLSMMMLMIINDSTRNSTQQMSERPWNPNCISLIGTWNVIGPSLWDVGSQPLKVMLQLCQDILCLWVHWRIYYRFLTSSIESSYPGQSGWTHICTCISDKNLKFWKYVKMRNSYLDHPTNFRLEVGYQDHLSNPSRHTGIPQSEQSVGLTSQKTVVYLTTGPSLPWRAINATYLIMCGSLEPPSSAKTCCHQRIRTLSREKVLRMTP